MVNSGNPYAIGYETAYRKIYAILADEGHRRDCGESLACGAVKETVEVLMEALAKRLGDDE